MITRFAPSPTGSLHLGGLRTALFNYLFASQSGGSRFFLRIEDTDQNRLVEEATEKLLEVLPKVGLQYQGEVVVQSTRLDRYSSVVDTLMDQGDAYKCFCSRERLDLLRDAQRQAKQAPGYDGRCSHLSVDQVKEKGDLPFVVRMKVPDEGTTVVQDVVRGAVRFDNKV